MLFRFPYVFHGPFQDPCMGRFETRRKFVCCLLDIGPSCLKDDHVHEQCHVPDRFQDGTVVRYCWENTADFNVPGSLTISFNKTSLSPHEIVQRLGEEKTSSYPICDWLNHHHHHHHPKYLNLYLFLRFTSLFYQLFPYRWSTSCDINPFRIFQEDLCRCFALAEEYLPWIPTNSCDVFSTPEI